MRQKKLPDISSVDLLKIIIQVSPYINKQNCLKADQKDINSMCLVKRCSKSGGYECNSDEEFDSFADIDSCDDCIFWLNECASWEEHCKLCDYEDSIDFDNPYSNEKLNTLKQFIRDCKTYCNLIRSQNKKK